MAQRRFTLSVKVLLRRQDGRVLLLRRATTSKANAGKWDFPGGKVDPREAFDAGIVREVLEETGLHIVLKGVAGAAESQMPERVVAYLFLHARLLSGELRLSEEHDAFLWMPPEEVSGHDLAPQFRALAGQLESGTADVAD